MEHAAAVDDLAVALEELTADAVPALVRLLVKIIRVLFVNALDERLHAALVTRFGGANEPVVRDAEPAPRRFERCRDSIDERLGRDTFFIGRLFDLLAMLVHPHEKMHLVASEPAIARDG